MKYLVEIFIYFFLINSVIAQDIIIKNSGDTVKCKITGIDSSKIIFDIRINDKVINTYLFRSEIRGYEIQKPEKSYEELLCKMSDFELDSALKESKKFVRNSVLCSVLGPICVFLGFVSMEMFESDNNIVEIVSIGTGVFGTIAGIVCIPISVKEKKLIKKEIKKRKNEY